ncbi:DUF262 domain-containing protein [Mycobacteroides abscessus]
MTGAPALVASQIEGGTAMLYGAASVEAKSMTVGEVMNERFPFAVPRYQRSYAWGDEAVGFFIRDIEAMLDQPAGQTSHFFGGVVCIQLTDNQKTRPTSYEVVDGQQRLATLMLALSCVVEVAEDLIKRCAKKDPQIAASASTLRDEIVENFVTWKESDVAVRDFHGPPTDDALARRRRCLRGSCHAQAGTDASARGPHAPDRGA